MADKDFQAGLLSNFPKKALYPTYTPLISCMAYIDLNPVRAGMASTPEQSEYTSIHERITRPDNTCLLPLTSLDDNSGIPFGLEDYLDFVDWAGRQIRNGKRGYIPEHTTPILARLWSKTAPVLDYLAQERHTQLTALGIELCLILESRLTPLLLIQATG